MEKPTFDSALEGLDRMVASVDERELVQLLAKHASEEGALLHRYERFTREASSSSARYLVALIVEDERRHHRVLAEMANAIAWEDSGEAPPGTVPWMAPASDEALQRETQALLAAERQDRRELQAFKKRLKDYEDTTLWGLLVELMLRDTDKHIAILTFIRQHVR